MPDLSKGAKARLKPIPTTLFSFRNSTFTAEASDLNGYTFNSYVRLSNPTTHGEIEFDLVNVQRDREGDVQFWEFASRSKAPLRIIIFND